MLLRSHTARRSVRLSLEALEDRLTPAVDAVLQWNANLLAAIRTGNTNPPKASRNMAIVQIAVYDAVNAIDRSHAVFLVDASAPAGTSREAAVVAAAHQALVSLYPAQQTNLDNLYAASLAAIPNGQAKDNGVALGTDVALQVILQRANDGSAAIVPYTPGTQPGDWIPTPAAVAPALLPGWGNVQTFGINTGNQFAPPNPPSLTSAEYTAAFNSIKALGVATGSTRTADQTAIAKFWADGAGTATPPGHWNIIASIVSQQAGLTLSQNARLFAELNVAEADAAIACWNEKYATNYWRPITAIRAAGTDGNPDTVADAAWTPLLATPPFPTYVSGHSTFSSAAATVLASFFGTDNVTFTVPTEDATVSNRTFNSFSSASLEAAASREFGGIHFTFDNNQGVALGTPLGAFTAANYFKADPNQNYGFINRLYFGLLGRAGSQAEIRSYIGAMDQGATRIDIVASFLGSLEYRSFKVNELYQQYLGRAAEAQGLQGWVSFLNAGGPLAGVAAQIAGSPEFFQTAGGNNDAFVNNLYRKLLHRSADPSAAESAGFRVALAAGADRVFIASLFVRSFEYSNILAETGINTLGGWYQQYLGRSVDTPALASLADYLGHGGTWEAVQLGILTSSEYTAL